jgi:hypothetical protein
MSQLVPVRKARAGSDSAGYTWPEDGSVVDVEYEHALKLVKIPDGGFSIVEPDEGLPAREPQDKTDEAPVRIEEPRPAPDVLRALTEPARVEVEQGAATTPEQLATEPSTRGRRSSKTTVAEKDAS